MVRYRGVLAAAVLVVLGGVLGPAPAHAATFGLVSGGGFFTVDTGAGLVFKIRQSGGDLTSLRFNGTELQPTGTNGSHVESGLGSTAVVTGRQTGNFVIITESVTNWYGSGTLVHYLVAVNGQNTIYMATFVDSAGGG